MKLCLGTAQLGMKYGITNDLHPNLNEAMQILNFAINNGITTIDTASSYGNSEEIIGSFLKNNTSIRENLHIITKTAGKNLESVEPKKFYGTLKNNLKNSLNKLDTDYIDSYFFHNSSFAYDYNKLYALSLLKKEGYIKYCGISLYTPEEAISAINSGLIDIIQIPFNLFDHRFLNAAIFSLAKEKNISIHCRSVYLQGLFTMQPQNLPPFLDIAKSPLQKLTNLASLHNLSILELAMSFVKSFPEIDTILIGVNSKKQLEENLTIFNKQYFSLQQIILDTFSNLPQKIYMPTQWH